MIPSSKYFNSTIDSSSIFPVYINIYIQIELFLVDNNTCVPSGFQRHKSILLIAPIICWLIFTFDSKMLFAVLQNIPTNEATITQWNIYLPIYNYWYSISKSKHVFKCDNLKIHAYLKVIYNYIGWFFDYWFRLITFLIVFIKLIPSYFEICHKYLSYGVYYYS